MSEKLSSPIENKDQAHTTAIAEEMARRVISTEMSLGKFASDADERIASASDAAEEGYLKSPSFNRDGEKIVNDFGKNTKVELLKRISGIEVSDYGTVEVNEEQGVTPDVIKAVEGAVHAANVLMITDIKSVDGRNKDFALAKKELQGPSMININPSDSEPRLLPVFGADPEGQKSEELILQMLGVDKATIDEALPTDKGVQRTSGTKEDGQFYIEHREISTNLPGITLEVRHWEGIPGARDENFSELALKRDSAS